MSDDDDYESTLRAANNALSDSLDGGFVYYYVAHNCWGQVAGQIGNTSGRHLQFVPEGQGPYESAGKAGSWLGNNGKKLSRLCIVAHGEPGSFTLGKKITSENVAPLGGWLSSFFVRNSSIQILSCNAASDQNLIIGPYIRGQMNPKDAGGGTPHVGYQLLFALATASGQKVEGALNGQAFAGLTLSSDCRRVYPNGMDEHFLP